jgi:hypothetical protein
VAKVFVDGRNVQRSQWPNLSDEELVTRVQAWANRHGHEAIIVFDGKAPEGAIGSGGESADDWLIREVPKHRGAWLVTSDRALRGAAAANAGRVIGGGGFLAELEK